MGLFNDIVFDFVGCWLYSSWITSPLGDLEGYVKLPTPKITKPVSFNHQAQNLDKLKNKGKKLHALLYLPTGEYIQFPMSYNKYAPRISTVVIPRNFNIVIFVIDLNNTSLNWFLQDVIKLNEITLPAIEPHFEKVELIY